MSQRMQYGLTALCLAVAFAACAGSPSAKTPQSASNGKITDQSYQRVMQSTDLAGQKVGATGDEQEATVLVFFASWCGPCRHELAILDELRREDPSVRVIGLNAYEDWGEQSDAQRLQGFLSEAAPWLQVVHADEKMRAAFGGVPKIPTMFVYDRYGTQVQAFRREKRRSLPNKAEIAQAISAAKQKLDL